MSILTEYRKDLDTLKDLTAFIIKDHNFEKWSEADVEEAINDAVLDLAIRAQMIKDEIAIHIEENRYIYDVKAWITAENNAAAGTNKEFGFLSRVGLSGVDEPSLMPSSYQAINFSQQKLNDGQGLYANRFYIDLLSPGKLQVIPPDADGEALPDEEGNIQVQYIGLPDYMDAAGDYPDSMVAPQFHDSIAVGAAAILLYEGNEGDLQHAVGLDNEFTRLIASAVASEYDGETNYRGARPA